MTETLSLGMGDVLVFLCAIVFAAHIMIIDYYSPKTDNVIVSCIQFAICGVVCGIGALIWGAPTVVQLQDGMGSLLYAGVLSCGVAYTLQIVGQKGVNPTVAALILSLESVVATVSGWIAYKIGFLTTDQSLTKRQIAGCIIVFLAVILEQLPAEWFVRKEKSKKST
jgi:drug/metabolite transporter (DMT)-like permease